MLRIAVSVVLVAVVVIHGNSKALTNEDTSGAANPEEINRLLLTPPSGIGERELMNRFQSVVLNVGQAGVSHLQKILSDESIDEDTRYVAAYGLALIGGEEAKRVLRDQYQRGGDPVIKSMACLAMAASGSMEEIHFLMDSLSVDNEDSDSWQSVEQASYSLGVLKYDPAVPILRIVSRKDPSSLVSEAAQLSMSWIETRTPAVPSVTSVNERIISATLSCCPIHKQFVDANTGKLWKLEKQKWNLQTRDKNAPEKKPSISYEIKLNSDSSRAIVSARAGTREFVYLLVLIGDTWEVKGLTRAVIYN